MCVPEDCLNGIDDDCNGKTDCQDDACGAFACGAAVPPGWRPAAIASALDAGCAAPFEEAGAFNEGPSGTVSCTCGCAANTGDCVGTLIQADNITCRPALTPNPTINGPVVMHADAGCQERFMTFVPSYYAQIVEAGPSSDTYAANTIATSNNVVCAASGTACVARAAGGGCQPSQPSCVPAIAKPFSACVSRSGDVPCPDGGAWTKHVIGARDADGGSSLSGDASCTACGCTPTSSCSGSSVLLQSGLCSGSPTPEIAVTEQCQIPGTVMNADSYVFTAARNASCAPGSSSPSGGVAFDAPTTICCPL